MQRYCNVQYGKAAVLHCGDWCCHGIATRSLALLRDGDVLQCNGVITHSDAPCTNMENITGANAPVIFFFFYHSYVNVPSTAPQGSPDLNVEERCPLKSKLTPLVPVNELDVNDVQFEPSSTC